MHIKKRAVSAAMALGVMASGAFPASLPAQAIGEKNWLDLHLVVSEDEVKPGDKVEVTVQATGFNADSDISGYQMKLSDRKRAGMKAGEGLKLVEIKQCDSAIAANHTYSNTDYGEFISWPELNGKTLKNYIGNRPAVEMLVYRPLVLTDNQENFDVRVIRVDTKRNRAVFSRKTVLVEEKRKAVAEIWSNLNVGDVVEGKVMRFTDYGAFVDIGGVDGLLHISEISWGKLKHPEEVLKIGDIINVKILSLNEEKGKISLGLKQTQPEPWTLVGDKYQVGDVLDGKVVQTKEYGAFVELEAGLDGLVHISEIANKRVENVSDELKVGETVKVKIMEIDPEKRRISLSIKAALPEEEAAPEEEAPAEEAAEVAEEAKDEE